MALVASMSPSNPSAFIAPSKFARAVTSPPSFGSGFDGSFCVNFTPESGSGPAARSPLRRAFANTSVESAVKLNGPPDAVSLTLGSTASINATSTTASSNMAAPTVPPSITFAVTFPSGAGAAGLPSLGAGANAANAAKVVGSMSSEADNGACAIASGEVSAPIGPTAASTCTSCSAPNTAAASVAFISESTLTSLAEKSMSWMVRSSPVTRST